MSNPNLTVIEFLQTIDDGGALEEFRAALSEVSQQVMDKGGKGSVSLKITLEKAKGNSRRVLVTDAVSYTVPKRQTSPSTFFVAYHGGQLSRRDPDQTSFMDMEAENENA